MTWSKKNGRRSNSLSRDERPAVDAVDDMRDAGARVDPHLLQIGHYLGAAGTFASLLQPKASGS